ncbi:MAG: hypothetical protein PF488_03600 [Patescibacteria group bacterium]|jgi:hypothetical protein|nr:hypothetical protein [Patescibacteria group bacterium]
MLKLLSIRNYFNKHSNNKKKFLLTTFSVLAVGAFFYVGYVLAAPTITLNSTPNSVSHDVPVTIASSTADVGKTIDSARFEIYEVGSTPTGSGNQCTAQIGTPFFQNYVEFKCEPASISDGEYIMRITVSDNDSVEVFEDTPSFIVDRGNPSVDYDPLPNTPNPIDYNDPVFTGTATDSMTKITEVQFAWLLASSSDPTAEPSSWTSCGGTYDDYTVSFTCDPTHVFDDSIKGDQYKMYIQAIDEAGNVSSYTNTYNFTVDTVDPIDLAITYPVGGETLYAGRFYDITWVRPQDNYELDSNPITIEYSDNDFVDTVTIVDNHLPSGPYPWDIPDNYDTTTAKIRLTAVDLATNEIVSTSTNFTIVPYSAPNVNIVEITTPANDATDVSPLTINATASDPENIASAQYSLDGGSYTSCTAQDGAFDETSETLVCGGFTLSSQGNHTIRVRAYDDLGDVGSDIYTFTYDTSAPSVNAGTLGTINLATRPGATASDAYTSIDSTSWSFVSGPGNIIFSDASTTNPYISADTYSANTYTARLTACDIVGNCASDTVDFIWTDQPIPENFNIVEPSGGERLSGNVTYGENFVIEWTSPGGDALDNFDIEYSLDDGTSWNNVVSDLASTATTYNWSIPNDNSENVRIRVIAQDNTNSALLTETSNLFTIDSTLPSPNAGDLPSDGEDPDIISTATTSGATATDNFDTDTQLTYQWSVVSSPGGADVDFSGSLNTSTDLDPAISGTVTGSYTVRLEATDRAGNIATSDVEFNWDGYPPDFSIIYPTGGEFFAGGDNIAIEWAESSSAVEYDIYYSDDNWISSSSIFLGTTGSTTGSNLYYDWTAPLIDSETVEVRVVGIDSYGNEGTVTSNTFGIDSTDPIVDAGTFYNVVLGPTQPGASSSDVWSGIETYSWTQDSGPGTLEFTDGAGNPAADTENPHIYADTPGVYVARLTVTDFAGNSAYDTVALITNTNPPTAVITSPGKDVHWKGDTTKNIQWDLNTDPGNLTDFNIDYSIDGGSTWQPASSTMPTVASTSRLLEWSVPMENSSSSVMRVITYNTDGHTATATQEFVIDSEAPVITPGIISSSTEATTTGTVIVDNIDSQSEVSYLWSVFSTPTDGQMVFSPSHIVMDPEITGTVTGEYIIQVIAQDQAGNLSTASIGDDGYIYWDGDPGVITITNPTSSVITPGGVDYTIEWYMEDPGDLTTTTVEYSLDSVNWNTIATDLASDTRQQLWSIDEGLNSTSSVVRVTAYDVDGNSSSGTSANFTIDSTPPTVDTGTMPSPISTASSSEGVTTIDNFDSLEYLTNEWTMSSLPYPEAVLTFASSTSLDNEFSGDMSGWYEALLSSTDRAGNTGTSSLSFYWTSEYDPYITYPTEGVHLPGGETSTATWDLINSGDLEDIEAHYSIDNGLNWVLVDADIASTSREIDWQVPDSTNSTTSLFRIYTVDNSGRHATATSQLFTIDSDDPYVEAGSYSDYVNSATAPVASTTDNLTDLEDLTISWTKVSGVGDINFSDSSAINPQISATRNDNYVARLTVTDIAGNSGTDTVSFERKISSGGGGGGTTYCSSVEYGAWEDCVDGLQHREIIEYDPAFCSPTSAQLAAEERSCTALETCASVTYSDWGDCVNGYQTRIVINREPDQCVLSEAQDASLTTTCGDPETTEGDDPNQVMEDARAQFTGEDPALVERLMGQILIQVEDLGRAWYVNVDDGARYYLGRPRNAFTVMSMLGKGITNEVLKKLPIGLLDPELSNDTDSDGDGLTDRLEEGIETDFFSSDTDGDGFSDYEEVVNGYDPLNANATKSIVDNNLLQKNLGQIFIQVETNGEAWYVEPKTEKRYYLGRPLEAFNVMRQFGIGITNENINKIPVGEFSSEQTQKITDMLE